MKLIDIPLRQKFVYNKHLFERGALTSHTAKYVGGGEYAFRCHFIDPVTQRPDPENAKWIGCDAEVKPFKYDYEP